MRHLVPLLLLLVSFFIGHAQETFPVNDVHDERDHWFAFTNATIITAPGKKIEHGTLIIKQGKIVAVGQGLAVPKGAVEVDLSGKYIYPSFIDLYADYGMPEVKKEPRPRGEGAQIESKNQGPFNWNQAIHPETNAVEQFSIQEKDAQKWRALGFGSVLTHQHDGIARGTSAYVALGEGKANEMVLLDRAAAQYAFNKGTSHQNYPNSLMGMIALLRQTYLDGKWYAQVGSKEQTNESLRAWNNTQSLPQIFEVRRMLSVMRADQLGDEFGKQYIIKGTGKEYQRIDAIKATNATLIIPLNFPKPYDVSDPYEAMNVSLQDMKHWELAPYNPAMLEKAGIQFALTTHGLKDKKVFLKQLREAIEKGLSEQQALAALTTEPARVMKVGEMIGTLDKGKYANFLITSGPIFEEKTIFFENWIKGKNYLVHDKDQPDIRGKYDLKVGDQTYDLRIKGDFDEPKLSIDLNDSTKLKVKHELDRAWINLSFSLEEKAPKTVIRLSGHQEGKNWKGRGQLPDGRWVDWMATYKGEEKEKEKSKDEKEASEPGPVTFPFLAYGWTQAPKLETVLLKNATVWTNEAEGVLEGTDVLLQNGKIAKIGKDLSAPGAKVIDATGKHITSGIIDEHSHIAIEGGVNECSESVTAEVRIGDVINSEDVNIYRQLAGGVTAAQLLHGSCNPIGGQSGLIKMRWGSAPEDMKIKGADGFIKFALGENVKRSRSDNNKRFPDTRMGVEQVYYDAFHRAKDYDAKKKAGLPVRTDLELETLLEIMNKKRFITCHSYVQSEINMLMHVADSMGFKINTFTHILEGYKVADKMKAHGVGGSTFSDWWAYKFEVYDAIPYNGALMHREGVVVAYNSDDAEMGRRLNQEAAKAVKYGGLTEEEALKFVTLNPAKLLHLDNRMGSIKVGKDADVVVWSDNPLSIYAKAEHTFVDGICYFDLEADKAMQEAMAAERARLIQKMLNAKQNGAKTRKPTEKPERLYHCDTIGP